MVSLTQSFAVWRCVVGALPDSERWIYLFQTRLLLTLSPCTNNTVRILIEELQPLRARYRVADVLTGEPQCEQ